MEKLLFKNNGDGMRSMMRIMVICCALPVLAIFLLGAGGKAIGTPTWVVLGGVVVIAAAHFFAMKRSGNSAHSCEEHETAIEGKKLEEYKDSISARSDHGCCH